MFSITTLPMTRRSGMHGAQRLMQRWFKRAQPWCVPLTVLAIWWIASRQHWMSEQVLPAPILVWQSAIEMAGGELWSNLGISLGRLAAGLLLGIILGALLGAWMGSSRLVERLILPTFSAMAQIPTLAWIPLLMTFLGIGEGLKLAVLVKAVVVPVTLHTLAGVRNAQPKLRESAAVLRLPKSALILRVIIPAAAPSFMAGVRMALSAGWSSLLAVELLASSEGIGYLMVWARQLFMLDIVFVCILVIGVIGVLMDRGITWLDRRWIFWPHPAVAQLPIDAARSGWQRFVPWLLPLLLISLWQLSIWQGWLDTQLIASVPQVMNTLFQGLVSGQIPVALGTSLGRTLGGLALGGSAGIVLGLLLGIYPLAERLLNPSLSALRQIAIFAWVPLLSAWFGLGEAAKWAFVSMAAFFPLFIATYRGVASLSIHLHEVAQVMQLGPLKRLRYLILPGAAPAIFSGLRLGLIYAWLGTIGAEYFMPSNGGIGSLMIGAQQLLRTDLIISCMLMIGLAGAALNSISQRLERRATRWRNQ
jgi:sulfonate transport system permease protein